MAGTSEEKNWKPLEAGGFMGAIGPLLKTREATGGFIYALQTKDEHSNAIGLVHGGVIAALLDQAISMVAWTAADRAPVVTVQLDIRFVGAAKPRAFLEATAKLRQRAGSMMFLDAEIRDDTQIVALATAVMKISGKAA